MSSLWKVTIIIIRIIIILARLADMEVEDAFKMLANTKRVLKEDLTVKVIITTTMMIRLSCWVRFHFKASLLGE